MRTFRDRFAAALSLLLVLLAAMPVRQVHAGAIIVNTAADQDNWLAMVADGNCGLREAIANANADAQTYSDCPAGSGADMITFVGNYTITLGAQNELLVTSPVTIRGNGAANTIIEADPTPFTSAYRVFEVDSGGNLTLDALTVRNGQCAGSCASDSWRGGGVLNEGTLTVQNSTFTFNRAQMGGGVSTGNGTTLVVTDSTFRENNATLDGGAIEGGGDTSIRSSSFSANSAYESGGGIYSNGAITLTNSTLAANAATQSGGAIFKLFGTLTMKNSTLSGNGAAEGGGVYLYSSQLNYTNTIIANSTFGDCIKTGLFSINTNKNNLVEDGSCLSTFFGDPNLGALDYYGGPTRSYALLPGSPAIDAGSSAACTAVDQRGVARPQGPACDLGAFELNQTLMALASLAPQDGWALESGESSGKGGLIDAGGTSFRLGDNAGNKQYRAVLSFATDSLPDAAVITSVKLKFKRQSVVGTDPFATLGKIVVDVNMGSLGSSVALQLGDFQASSDKNGALGFQKSSTRWYSKALAGGNLAYVSTQDPTQFRLRFARDDNNNAVADYLKFYSGDAATAGDRPQLIITYYLP